MGDWKDRLRRDPRFVEFARRHGVDVLTIGDEDAYGLYPEYVDWRIDNRTDEGRQFAMERIREKVPAKYKVLTVDDFPDKRRLYVRIACGCSGIIIGDNGVGKTAFVWSVYKRMMMAGMAPVLFVEAPDLMDDLNRAVNRDDAMLAKYVDMEWGRYYPHLFIDEMDKVRQSEASARNILALISQRYANDCQIVCVANGDETSIRRNLTQHAYSRLTATAEGNFMTVFEGPDRRRD